MIAPSYHSTAVLWTSTCITSRSSTVHNRPRTRPCGSTPQWQLLTCLIDLPCRRRTRALYCAPSVPARRSDSGAALAFAFAGLSLHALENGANIPQPHGLCARPRGGACVLAALSTFADRSKAPLHQSHQQQLSRSPGGRVFHTTSHSMTWSWQRGSPFLRQLCGAEPPAQRLSVPRTLPSPSLEGASCPLGYRSTTHHVRGCAGSLPQISDLFLDEEFPAPMTFKKSFEDVMTTDELCAAPPRPAPPRPAPPVAGSAV